MQETMRAEITDLGVRGDARRRGIATALLETALDWVRASGATRIEVQVAHANAVGQAFWRARGFGDFMDVLDKRL
jgi:ribosomal protein S18 acetylase RimI-like enzyme